MTTSNTLDRGEKAILAEHYFGSKILMFVLATPFDYDSGHVNPRDALDPVSSSMQVPYFLPFVVAHIQV